MKDKFKYLVWMQCAAKTSCREILNDIIHDQLKFYLTCWMYTQCILYHPLWQFHPHAMQITMKRKLYKTYESWTS